MSATPKAFNGRQVSKPWGYELIWAETERYAGKTLHIERGEQLSFQYHRQKDETIHLLSGVLDLVVAEENGASQTVRLQPGQSFRIPAGLRHSMIAVDHCDVLEVSTPELDDVVRLQDRYGRAEK